MIISWIGDDFKTDELKKVSTTKSRLRITLLKVLVSAEFDKNLTKLFTKFQTKKPHNILTLPNIWLNFDRCNISWAYPWNRINYFTYLECYNLGYNSMMSWTHTKILKILVRIQKYTKKGNFRLKSWTWSINLEHLYSFRIYWLTLLKQTLNTFTQCMTYYLMHN